MEVSERQMPTNAHSYKDTQSLSSRAFRIRIAGECDSGKFRKAVEDVTLGLALYPLWTRLGWNDILQRYRRSLLGPFWLTASMGIMVVALGIIYARLFKIEINEFMPFLAAGLLIWNFISSTVSEAGALFTGSESYIKQVRLPFSLYVYRFVWGKIIILAHNAVVFLGVIWFFGVAINLSSLLVLVGLAVVILNLALLSVTLGVISARFRDIPQIINNFVQIGFFITPIMWKPELLSSHSELVLLNPLFHIIEVLRAPMLGQNPETLNYLVVAMVSAANLMIAGYFFARFRARIAYWV